MGAAGASCAPDYDWPPTYIRYAPDHTLLVISPSKGGIRFDAEGTCLEKQSYGTPMFTRMIFTPDGHLRMLSFMEGFVVHTRRPDGTVLNEKPILLPAIENQSPVKAVRDGRVYIMSYPDAGSTDQNPTVLTYRFTGK